MNKNIISERELQSLVKKVVREEKLNNINEALPRRERERHETNWKKKSFEPYDREKDIMSAFGSYSSDLPANVISYLRKNPRTFLKKIVDIYGMDKVLDFIGYRQPEMTEDYDNYMDDSIFDGIDNDIMEMSEDEALDYLDEIINYCINKKEDLGYDDYMGDSIFGDIDNDIMEMSEDEALDYLDEIINYCINKKEDLGYDNYMDDVHEYKSKKPVGEPNSLKRKINKTDIKNKLASLRSLR
jgi:polyhydroxyalkanoate synthesis regulator phasin